MRWDVTINEEVDMEVRRATFVSRTPFEAERIHAAAVYCSDGRFGDQMDDFLHLGLELPRYDRVAVPGGGACLAGHSVAIREEGAMEKQLRFLVENHALRRVVLIAHQDCAFYKLIRLWGVPLEEQQVIDLRKAAGRIREWNLDVAIEGYFARKVEGKVQFEALAV